MIREFTCIGCPMGCNLSVTLDENGKFISVEGYTCGVGKRYAEEEVTCPTRMVTSLIKVSGSKLPLSVKTSKAIDKTLIFACLAAISKCTVKSPVHIGDVVIPHVCGTDVDILASREIE